jgi:hypothetical protein
MSSSARFSMRSTEIYGRSRCLVRCCTSWWSTPSASASGPKAASSTRQRMAKPKKPVSTLPIRSSESFWGKYAFAPFSCQRLWNLFQPPLHKVAGIGKRSQSGSRLEKDHDQQRNPLTPNHFAFVSRQSLNAQSTVKSSYNHQR